MGKLKSLDLVHVEEKLPSQVFVSSVSTNIAEIIISEPLKTSSISEESTIETKSEIETSVSVIKSDIPVKPTETQPVEEILSETIKSIENRSPNKKISALINKFDARSESTESILVPKNVRSPMKTTQNSWIKNSNQTNQPSPQLKETVFSKKNIESSNPSNEIIIDSNIISEKTIVEKQFTSSSTIYGNPQIVGHSMSYAFEEGSPLNGQCVVVETFVPAVTEEKKIESIKREIEVPVVNVEQKSSTVTEQLLDVQTRVNAVPSIEENVIPSNITQRQSSSSVNLAQNVMLLTPSTSSANMNLASTSFDSLCVSEVSEESFLIQQAKTSNKELSESHKSKFLALQIEAPKPLALTLERANSRSPFNNNSPSAKLKFRNAEVQKAKALFQNRLSETQSLIQNNTAIQLTMSPIANDGPTDNNRASMNASGFGKNNDDKLPSKVSVLKIAMAKSSQELARLFGISSTDVFDGG